MKKIKNLAPFIFIMLLICSCYQTYDTEAVGATVERLGIKDGNTIILNISYNHIKRIPGPMGDRGEDINGGSYSHLVEINVDTKGQIIKGEKNLGGRYQMLCRDNFICLDAMVFLNDKTYKVVKTVDDYGWRGIEDFTVDLKRVLLSAGSLSYGDLRERNLDTGLETELLPDSVRDAKYCPVDETVLAYVGNTTTANNISGDLYTMNNDGTNITSVLSSYDIKKIYWKPDGNTIVFMNDNGIWNIEKNGTNLIKVSDFQLPQDYEDFALYYNLVAYIDKNENVVTERF